MNRHTNWLTSLVVVVFGLTASTVVFAECSGDSNYKELLGKGEKAYRENQFDTASEWYAKANESCPSTSEPWYMLGRIEKAKNDGKKNFQTAFYYKKAVAFAKDELKILYLLELALIHLDDPIDKIEAEKALAQIGHGIGPIATHLLFAERMLNKDDWVKAVDHLDELSKIYEGIKSESGAKNVTTTQAMKAVVYAWRIDQSRSEESNLEIVGSRAKLAEKASEAVDKALKLNRKHGTANFIAGFLIEQPEAKAPDAKDKWRRPNLSETQRAFALEKYHEGKKLSMERLSVSDTVPSEAYQRVIDSLTLSAENLKSWMESQVVFLGHEDWEPPKIEALGYSKGKEFKTSHDHVWLLVRATDNRKLKNVKVQFLWNREELNLGPIEGKGDRLEKLLEPIELPIHEKGPPYEIWITAEDYHPHTTTLKLVFTYVPPTSKRRVYLLGISDYPILDPNIPGNRKLPRLNGVKKDIDDLYNHFDKDMENLYERFFRSKSREIYKRENIVKKYLNDQADVATVERILGWIADQEKDSEAILYFSGHGFVKGGKSCIELYDLLQRTCKTIDDLVHSIKDSQAEKISIIIDTCYSSPQRVTLAFNGPLRYLLTATSSDETAKMKIDGSGSLFSQTLLEVLQNDSYSREADRGLCGCVEIEEASKEVTILFNRRSQRGKIRQHPQGFSTRGDHTLKWRPREAVTLHWVEELTSREPADRSFYEEVRRIIKEIGGRKKEVVMDIMGDLTRSELDRDSVLELLKQVVLYFQREATPL